MFQSTDHYQDVSLLLSEVLDDIGVNQWLIEKRKTTWLLYEGFENVISMLYDDPIRACVLGSQIEGSTTVGLRSDLDKLYIHYICRVIHDLSEWRPFIGLQVLMLQDQTTAPGYCLLQATRPDAPLPLPPVNEIQDILNTMFKIDCRGRLLLKHDSFLVHGHIPVERRGPAGFENQNMGFGFSGTYSVKSIYCPSWPREADPWLHQQNPSGWPTEDLKRCAAQSGCFLVPAASRDSKHGDTEWRISTCLAERALMHSLNVTQLRCYVLLKMITKYFLHPDFYECVTSYVCKTVLFSCIANSIGGRFWCENNLLACLNTCLQRLSHCIETANCPHFIIPENNLLKGKLSPNIKHRILRKMSCLKRDIVQALTGVSTDDLGTRLSIKLGRLSQRELASKKDILGAVVSNNIKFIGLVGYASVYVILTDLRRLGRANVQERVLQVVSKLSVIRTVGNAFEIRACNLIMRFLCTILGSLLASDDIARDRGLSPETLSWFSAGLDSDVGSSRLKQTSALYSVGEFGRCEIILNDLQQKFTSGAVCYFCSCQGAAITLPKFTDDIVDKNDEDAIKENLSLCVKYLPSETCIPSEMKYELFRSTGDDVQYRRNFDQWMDFAVVDCLPFMYFLQYKVYSQLQRPAEKWRALSNLEMIIVMENLARAYPTDPRLGHKETALNLLGQCYEQENRIQPALCCFTMSLNVRNRNNAAKWHICKLLAAQFRQRHGLL